MDIHIINKQLAPERPYLTRAKALISRPSTEKWCMVFSCRMNAATLPNCVPTNGAIQRPCSRPSFATSCTDHSTGNLIPRYLRRFRSTSQRELRWISMQAKRSSTQLSCILQVLRQLRRTLDSGRACEVDLILTTVSFIQKNQLAPPGIRYEISSPFSFSKLVGVGETGDHFLRVPRVPVNDIASSLMKQSHKNIPIRVVAGAVKMCGFLPSRNAEFVFCRIIQQKHFVTIGGECFESCGRTHHVMTQF